MLTLVPPLSCSKLFIRIGEGVPTISTGGSSRRKGTIFSGAEDATTGAEKAGGTSGTGAAAGAGDG